MTHSPFDVLLSHLVEGATFEGPDEIPIIKPLEDTVPLPHALVRYDQRLTESDHGKWVHFYESDNKFLGVVTKPDKAEKEIRPFSGMLTPDFSLFRDAPIFQQKQATIYNRAVGHYMQRLGIPVVCNVRWSDEHSFDFAYAGAPHNATLAVSNHGCWNSSADKYYFILGFKEMIARLEPRRIIFHGRFTEDLRKLAPNVEIAVYMSDIQRAKEGC